MSRFRYIARNDRGVLTRGELEAPSGLALHSTLQRLGSKPVSIAPVEYRLAWWERLKKLSWRDAFGPRSDDAEIALKQLALHESQVDWDSLRPCNPSPSKLNRERFKKQSVRWWTICKTANH